MLWINSCNDINDPYAKLCIPDVANGINVKIFNLTSRINETRHIGWHEYCRWKCRLNESVCNNKQRWNKDKCRCDFKELIDKSSCTKGFIWNPSNYECECDKSCDVGEYLDYESCKCSKRLIDKLAEEFSENIDGNQLVYNSTMNNHKKVCSTWTVYIVLFVTAFLIIISISSAFIYFHWYSERRKIYWNNNLHKNQTN